MTPKITDEMRKALEQHPDDPLKVEDEQTRKVYFLIDSGRAQHLLDEWLRRELKVGLDQADRGESQPWDIDETLAQAHHRHASRRK